MKQHLNPTRIIVKLRCAYSFQCASTWKTDTADYFGLMTEALYEFAMASWRIQKDVLQDRICRACVAAWIVHTEPCTISAWQHDEDEEALIDAEDQDRAITTFMKNPKNFTAENVLSVFYWTGNTQIRWNDQTVTQTPGHWLIDDFLGKHQHRGTRRRHVPSGERRIRGAH